MKSQSARIGLRIIHLLQVIVNGGILVGICGIMAFAGYALWDTQQVYQAADAAQYTQYKPGNGDQLSFEELKKRNPEVFGWLTVYGTNIDYPVTQAEDNQKYVSTDVLGKPSMVGSIFLDAQTDPSFRSFNHVIYGHHMDKQAMFGELDRFVDAAYFDQHQYGTLFFDGQTHGLEFVLFYKTDAYDQLTFAKGTEAPELKAQYLAHWEGKAVHCREPISLDERYVLLTTCASDQTNGRDVLVAKLTDRIMADPFVREGSKERVDRVKQYAWWVGLLLLLVLLLIWWLLSRRKKNAPANKEEKNELDEKT